MRKLAIVVAALVLAGIGYIAFGKYHHDQFVESLVPHVKNASLRAANSARYEAEGGSKITYKELFEKVETDVAEIDKRLLEVQTLSSPATKATTDPTVAYLKASQEYLRALLSKYRKQLAFSNAMDWAERSVDELRDSSAYGRDYAKRSADKAMADLEKAEKEYNESLPELLATITKLRDLRDRVKSLFPEDALIPAGQLDAIVQKNSPKVGPAASTPK